jgi:predicted Zn finger-like uncharacterized protein
MGPRMTVDCPRCGTTYRVPDEHARRGDATFECAKCRHVFGGAGTADEPDDDWRDEPEGDDFRFDDAVPAPVAEEYALPDHEDEPEDEQEEQEHDATPPRRRRAGTPAPRPPGVARFALRSLIAVTLGYAVLSVWASTHEDGFRALLGRVPLVGARLSELPLSPADVALRDVRGEYDHLTSGELVFVIRGTAKNLAAGPLRRIRVEGRVAGGEERRQTVSCTDAPTELRKMSRQMLALMEDVRESRPTPVPPGESVACEVVIVSPPRPLTELSLEVVSVVAG